MVIPPTVALRRYYPAQLAGQSLTILDFSDPRKYPELFTEDHRLDGMHLNYAGAELFTEAIARKFAKIVRSSGPAR
jgi:lysophospholipase L1-like esterase